MSTERSLDEGWNQRLPAQEHSDVIQPFLWDTVSVGVTRIHLSTTRRTCVLVGIQNKGANNITVGDGNCADGGSGWQIPTNNAVVFFVGQQPLGFLSSGLAPGPGATGTFFVPVRGEYDPRTMPVQKRLVIDLYYFWVVAAAGTNVVSYFWTLPPLL